ncbi:MAG: hypothetical protein Q4C52_01470 [Eubacteriales bacterium]|nr:hypothetical protein [Eubacteriales bacterium]
MKEPQKEQILRYRCDIERISVIKKGAVALVALMTIAFGLTGIYSCQSMGDSAVFISWALYLIPLVIAWIGLLHMLRLGENMTPKQQKKGPARLLWASGVAMLISGAGIFCCIYFLVTGEYESFSKEFGMVIRVTAQFVFALGTTLLARYNLRQLEE